MNKLFIATVLAAATTAASAAEFGLTGSHDVDSNRNSVGVTVGNKYGPVGVTAGFDRTTAGVSDQNRYSLVGSYDVAKAGPVTFDARAGVAYVDNQKGWDGYAGLVGVGASVPLTKTVSATVDVTRQFSDVGDGNRVTAGLKYKF
jgi:hypothetical protein